MMDEISNTPLFDSLFIGDSRPIECVDAITAFDRTKIAFSTHLYGHLISPGALLRLEEIISSTLDFYERYKLDEDAVKKINERLSREQSVAEEEMWRLKREKAPTKSKRRQRTSIYVIRDESSSAIKVGKSKNPESRLMSHQISNPHKLDLICTYSGHDEDERELHVKLKAAGYHINGEWFKDCGEALRIIQEHFESRK